MVPPSRDSEPAAAVALRAGGTGLRIEPRPDESLLAEMRQHGTWVAELRAEAEGRLYAAAVACNVRH